MKTVKKPTKAHKGKKVIKAHEGMAHVPKSTQGQLTRQKPIAPRPQLPRIQRETPLRQPAVVGQPIKRRRPPRISDGALDGGGRRTITPRKLTSREKRRRDNAFKSQADEMFRRYNKSRQPRIATEQPKGIRLPTSPRKLTPDQQSAICPSPDTLINLSNNKTTQAGKLAVGDTVYTQHENTLEWGDYTVSHISIIPDSERLKLVFDTTEIVCSLSHKMYVDNKGWTKAEDMKLNDVVSGHTLKDIMEWEAGDVVKITVEDAHSYIAAGLLSHNKSIAYLSPPNQPRVAMPYVNPAQRRNKGGSVKKKYSEVKTLKQGGYISRAKYGSTNNLKK